MPLCIYSCLQAALNVLVRPMSKAWKHINGHKAIGLCKIGQFILLLIRETGGRTGR
jgi:hypothetical protein